MHINCWPVIRMSAFYSKQGSRFAHHTPVGNSSDIRTPVSEARNQLPPLCMLQILVLFLIHLWGWCSCPPGGCWCCWSVITWAFLSVSFPSSSCSLGAIFITESSPHHMTISIYSCGWLLQLGWFSSPCRDDHTAVCLCITHLTFMSVGVIQVSMTRSFIAKEENRF